MYAVFGKNGIIEFEPSIVAKTVMTVILYHIFSEK